MKTLILSVTAGQGHHKAAGAVYDYFSKRGVECVKLDLYEYLSPFIKEAIDKGYLISTSKMPKAYGKLYRLAEKKTTKSTTQYFLNKIFSTKFHEVLDSINADTIICTHVFAANLISYMKKKDMINSKTYGVITDFTIHPYWDDAKYLDYYILPNELIEYQAVKKGLNKEKLLPFGIPISTKFMSKINKTIAREKLGIEVDKRTILFMSGSMGYGNMGKMIKELAELDSDFQIISVCGNNKKMFEQIENLKNKHTKTIYNYGYVNNVDLMMDACDCIVTKPGGLTSSEALAKEVPMILIRPIPGQEDRNCEFFLNNGVAMKVTKTFPISQCIYELFEYPYKLDMMVTNAKYISKKNSVVDLFEFMVNHL